MIKFVFFKICPAVTAGLSVTFSLALVLPPVVAPAVSSVANYKPRHQNIFTFYTEDDS